MGDAIRFSEKPDHVLTSTSALVMLTTKCSNHFTAGGFLKWKIPKSPSVSILSHGHPFLLDDFGYHELGNPQNLPSVHPNSPATDPRSGPRPQPRIAGGSHWSHLSHGATISLVIPEYVRLGPSPGR